MGSGAVAVRKDGTFMGIWVTIIALCNYFAYKPFMDVLTRLMTNVYALGLYLVIQLAAYYIVFKLVGNSFEVMTVPDNMLRGKHLLSVALWVAIGCSAYFGGAYVLNYYTPLPVIAFYSITGILIGGIIWGACLAENSKQNQISPGMAKVPKGLKARLRR